MPQDEMVSVSIPIGIQIRVVRHLRGLKQGELATLIETSQQTLSFIETGYVNPSDRMLANIKRILRWPPRADEAFAILAASDGDESQEEQR